MFDSLSELTVCDASISSVLNNENVHVIIVQNSYSVVQEIKSKLGRKCNIIDVKPFSSKEATQCLVYSVMADNSYVPSDVDRQAFKSLGKFTCGCPTVTEITSKILQSRFSKCEDKHEHLVCTLAEELSLDEREMDVNFDSWHSLLELILACNLSEQHQLLLRCLAIFRSSPIPISLASELATIISSTPCEDKVSSENLLFELQQFKLVKNYPLPVLVPPSFCHHKANVDESLICVPQCLADCLWNNMDKKDQFFAVLITSRTHGLTTFPLTSGIIDGLYLHVHKVAARIEDSTD